MIQNFKVGRVYNGSAGDILIQEKTVNPSTEIQEVVPDIGYQGLSKVTVSAIPTVNLSTPNISINSDGLITSTLLQPAGYIASETMKTNSLQMITRGSEQITPGAEDITLSSNIYLTGPIIIKGDENLKAENIREGISLFGITGTHSGAAPGEKTKFEKFLQGDSYEVTEAELAGVKELSDYKFANSNLSKITIPNTVTSIRNNCFRNCTNLYELELPDSITSLGGYFISYSNVAEVNIPPLITELVQSFAYSYIKKINIPNKVTRIWDGFNGCNLLETLTFEENSSCSEIGWTSFIGCLSLNNVSIPVSVRKIDYRAFGNCNNLTNISYEGTIEQWNVIEKHSEWKYNSPVTVVHCSDGDVSV